MGVCGWVRNGALRLTPGGATLYVAAEDTTGIRQIVSDAVTFVAVPGQGFFI